MQNKKNFEILATIFNVATVKMLVLSYATDCVSIIPIFRTML
jgi:hypothetical protein